MSAIIRLKKVILFFATLTVFAPGVELSAGELLVEPGLLVFPVITGLTQDIAITLSSPGASEVLIEAKSGWGVLIFPSGPSNSGKVLCSPGVPYHIQYRWAGAPPIRESADEIIKAEAPGRGLSSEVSFKVGIDLQIDAITMPDRVAPGVFNPIDIELHDAFGHDMDVASLYGKIGASPEITMSLVCDSASGEPVRTDPVVRKFFGDAPGGTSYPAASLVRGAVTQRDGRFIWLASDGRVTGITPPSGGTYHIEATLKSNAGGVALKHWASPRFEVSSLDAGDSAGDLPPLAASTLRVLYVLDREAASRAGESFVRGNELSIGEALFGAFAQSPAPMLGKYSAALGASGRPGDEIAAFLGGIMKGFPGLGVLLVTRGGLAEWSAPGAIYEDDRFLAIPFESGKNLTVRLTGSESGEVSLWKIIPQGVNAKKYPGGRWIKEITVYTSELSPPQNAKLN